MLPLLFQIGFGLSPVITGALIFASGVGSLLTRPVLTMAIKRYGFRNMLIGATIVTSLLYFSFALLRPGMSYFAMVALLLLSGAARGMLLVSMNTLGYTEIPKERMSYATAMATMGQQVAHTFGVAMAVILLNLAMQTRSSETLIAEDFWLGFALLGVINALALIYFFRLPGDAGQELTPSDESPT
jgi:MFS family permease